MQGKREKPRVWRNNGISRMEQIPRSPRSIFNREYRQENIELLEVEEDENCKEQGNRDREHRRHGQLELHDVVDESSSTPQAAERPASTSQLPLRPCPQEGKTTPNLKAASLPPSTPHQQLDHPVAIEQIKQALSQKFKSARKAFAFFDLKGAGKISPKEFKSGLDELGVSMDSSSLKEIYKRTVRNGFIHSSEFLSVFSWEIRTDSDATSGANVPGAKKLLEKSNKTQNIVDQRYRQVYETSAHQALGKSASQPQRLGAEKNPLSSSSKPRTKARTSTRSKGIAAQHTGSKSTEKQDDNSSLLFEANQVLKLRGVTLGSKEARDVIVRLQNDRALVVLDISDSSISVSAADIITKALVSDTKLSGRISSIIMSRSPAGDQVAEKMWSCLSNTNVAALDLQSTLLSPFSGASLAKALNQGNMLSHLHLGGNSLLSTGVEALAPSLPHAAKLECLHLEGNGIDDNGAKALSQVLGRTRITHLYLANNEISNIGAAILLEVIKNRDSTPQPISRIDLSHNPIPDSDREFLSLESGGKFLFGSSAKSPLISYPAGDQLAQCR
uniref:EF-hand domain-containing protein n=1 Tax=Hanusia phi TaxID=3032 RepID=A0A7S0DYY3_9CRYP|mmetsp:Transcript_11241/g.25496  ORF Transcript_11241/g.25496 Transcript_11241/m.25496 type:complete len:559 (+) Transcript_11241:208-1884(+)